MNLLVVLAIVGAMIALRFLKPNALAWMGIWWVACYIFLSYGIEALPGSLVFMFMGIVTIVLLTQLSANSEDMENAKNTVVNFISNDKYKVPLIVVVLLIPMLSAWKVYSDMNKPVTAPGSGRTIHPPPPQQITFLGKPIDLVNVENPYRAFETTNADSFAAHLANGRRVYFQNCVYCHGDDMKGKGNFAHALDPLPANFADPTTIAMLQESYLVWRIAKGGPGLPDEATPWLSAMPAWEKFLTEEEIWDVILFLYEYTNQVPRAREEMH